MPIDGLQFGSSNYFAPFNPYQGVPGTDPWQPTGMLAQFGLAAFGTPALQNMGMMPFGISSQNMYDRMQTQRLTMAHNQMLQQSAAAEQQSYYQTARGMFSLFQIPFGPEQQQFSRDVAGFVSSIAPMGSIIAPNFFDEIAGFRGSPTVFSHQAFLAGRNRIDPVTGRMGLGDSMSPISDQVFQQLFAGNNYQNMSGLSAGQAGQLFDVMQHRGMIPGTQGVAGLDPATLKKAAGDLGIKLPDNLQAIDHDTLAKLQDHPAVQGDLQRIDATQIAKSLRDRAGAVKAMSEIFGEQGRSNAPFAELVNALNQFTGGAMSQIDPKRIESLVRDTANMAKVTGMGIDGAMAMQQYAGMRGAAMGLHPALSVEAAQQAMGMVGAFQGLGFGAFNAWGRGDIDEQAKLATDLAVSAAASPAANMMGAALRIDEQMGVVDAKGNVTRSAFRADSDAARYVAAAKAGQTTFVNSKGKVTSMNMFESDFARMMEQGANGALGTSQIFSLLSQTQQNAEATFKFDAGDTARSLQREEAQRMVGDTMQFAAVNQLAGMGVGKADQLTLGDALSKTAASTLFSLDQASVTDTTKRNAAMEKAMADALNKSPAGRKLLAKFQGDKRQQLLAGLAMSMYGEADQELTGTAYGGIQNMLVQQSEPMLNQAARVQAEAKATTMLQSAFAPLGRNSVLRLATQAVMEADVDDPKALQRIFAKSIGAIDDGTLAATLSGKDGKGGVLEKLHQQTAEFDKAAKAYEAVKDPAKRAELKKQLEARRDAITSTMKEISTFATKAGVFEGDPNQADIAQAHALRAHAKLDGTGPLSNEEYHRLQGKAAEADAESTKAHASRVAIAQAHVTRAQKNLATTDPYATSDKEYSKLKTDLSDAYGELGALSVEKAGGKKAEFSMVPRLEKGKAEQATPKSSDSSSLKLRVDIAKIVVDSSGGGRMEADSQVHETDERGTVH